MSVYKTEHNCSTRYTQNSSTRNISSLVFLLHTCLCLCDVSEYLRLADCRLFNHIQCSSHCLSHLLWPEKHHIGLRPRGHRYTLPICPNELCKSSFYTTKFIFFPLIFFHLQCLSYSVLNYCITFAFVICFNRRDIIIIIIIIQPNCTDTVYTTHMFAVDRVNVISLVITRHNSQCSVTLCRTTK